MREIMTVNTRILKAEFEYLAPDALQEAVQLLSQYSPNAKVIAGGTDLMVQMKKEVISPRYLINIMKISDMSFIKSENGWLRIGAATKWRDVVEFCAKGRKYAALYEASRSVGKVQVRNMGTIGGNLCTGSPAADSAPALLVFDSRVKLCNMQGERTLDLRDFFKGVNVTAMAPNEIMTEVQIPSIPNGMGSAFMKTTRVGSDISKINCAVAVERQGDLCTSCRIAMGAVAPVPMRAIEAEGIVAGKKVDALLVEEMGQKVSAEIRPITDIRSTAEYRRQVASILLKDVFWKAWERAGGEE
jgi:CO/xanthine dehydrogenase FAD-binding subunit